MLSEKRLEELEHQASHNSSWYDWLRDDEDLELLRLARLGIWAEQHGIPAMQEFKEKFLDRYHPGENWFPETLVIGEALKHLPKAVADE